MKKALIISFNLVLINLFFLVVIFSCNKKEEAIVKYYKDGTINVFCPIDSDSLAHGLVIHYFPQGSKEVETEYVHGKKHGDYRTFYKSGNLHGKGQYTKGHENGCFIEYYDSENADIKSKTQYNMGQKNGMYYFFRKNKDTSSYGYIEMDTTKFYVLFDEKGNKEDYYSESAIFPKKTTLSFGDDYAVDFKAYGVQNKTVDIDYFLINFENLDTIKKGVISNYEFNTGTNLVFRNLERGRHFLNFKVPMLDSVFILNSFVTVGDIPDSTFIN